MTVLLKSYPGVSEFFQLSLANPIWNIGALAIISTAINTIFAPVVFYFDHLSVILIYTVSKN